jgi:hypothetical protein
MGWTVNVRHTKFQLSHINVFLRASVLCTLKKKDGTNWVLQCQQGLSTSVTSVCV